MASANDIRDILSLPREPSTSTAVPRKSGGPGTGLRKPEGISRELYSLLGDNVPTLVAQFARPKFKQKPVFGKGKSTWEWKPFTNSARADSLKLHHWVKKGSAEGTSDSTFAQYSTASQIFTYSQDEYTKHLEDQDWSKEETDYLFAMAKEYDLRFLVIHDRYEFPEGKPRAIEDLKWRYYSVCRRLIRSRPWAGDDASKNHLLASYNFDKEQETMRKAYLTGLFERTPDQMAEEEALTIELRRLEQTERRFAKEREDLLRTLGGIESGLAGLKVDPDASAAFSNDAKRKKRRLDGEIDSPGSGAANLISLGLSSLMPPKRKDSIKQAAYDDKHCMTRVDSPATSSAITKSSHQPVHLRSTRIPIPKANVAQKINAVLTEMAINSTRLVMPTKSNIEKMEALQNAAAGLVDIKKVVDRVDQEIRVLRARLGQEDEGGDEDAEGDVDADADADAEADMDAEGEHEVSVPIASTSAAQEKNLRKRSMSIASTGTSLTTNTRASMKRQRRE